MDILEENYYNPEKSASYGGIERLRKASGLKRKAVVDWLSYQDTYTKFKPVKRKFKRRRIIVGHIDAQWEADLVDMRLLSKYNDGINYILTCIDVLSKYAWVVPLHRKTGKELVDAFQSIFDTGRKPQRLHTDKGSEFKNHVFQTFLKKNNVHFFVTENEDIKASIAERFNRSFKTRVYRYFEKYNTNRYIDVIHKLTQSYNNTYHRSIKEKPANVSKYNQETVWQALYADQEYEKKSPKLQVGDRVRIVKTRRIFDKGYASAWTEELFTVTVVNKTTPTTYTIRDDNNEVVKGSFYENELGKVGEKEFYEIEEILRVRGKGIKREYLVKWRGYPSSFNSWVSATAIRNHVD